VRIGEGENSRKRVRLMSFAGELELENELELEWEASPTRSSHAPAGAHRAQSDVNEARRIAAKPVPGMPGVTIAQLIERYRPSIAPEIPLQVLIAFIRFESGGNFSDATHGHRSKHPPFQHIPQPPFYELGLFQTPAGRYGRCAQDGTKCEFPPPGREVPSDPSSWVRLCKKIGADPQAWTNPNTQVRVGLYDLKTNADRIRHSYPRLFPNPGSDWYLRMAVLMPFARGPGFARGFLSAFQHELERLAESQRWNALRDKRVSTHRVNWTFDPDNVDKKMSTAAKIGYRPR
jgi:hypothetical protein